MKRTTTLLAALGLAVAAVVIPAAPAAAAPPTLFNDWSTPVLPVGGTNSMSFTCGAGDGGGTATVDVDGPGALDATGVGVGLGVSGNGALRLGGSDATGGIQPSALGTYAYEVTCPSGGGSTTFSVDVIAPTVVATIGWSDGEGDCSTPVADASLPIGADAEVCYVFTNPLGAIVGFAGRVISATAEVGGFGGGFSFTYPTQFSDPPLPAGGSYTTTRFDGAVQDAQDLDAWVVLDDGAGGYATSAVQRVSLTPTPGIAVTVTSGLQADQACPENGGVAERTVDAGTEVFFCYSVELLSSNPVLDDHTITSDVQGTVVEDLAEPLNGVGTTFEYGVPTGVTIDATTVNTGTWTAFDSIEYLDSDFAVTATGQATVSVVGQEPSTTTTTGGSTTTAPPATATAAQPTFTG